LEKKKVIETIQEYLQGELKSSRVEPTERDAQEIQRLLTMYKFLPSREYAPDDVIIPSSLVQLRFGTTEAYYFITPQGGGLITRVEGKPVQVITPQSPLGEVLLGKKTGDEVKVEIRGVVREYKIIAVT